MSSGEMILNLPGGHHYKLLDTIGALDNGVWISVFEFRSGLLHFVTVGGTVGLTVQVRGSNAPTLPANSAHAAQVGSDQVFATATETVLSIDNCPRWIKARVSAWTAGTVSVYGIFRPS